MQERLTCKNYYKMTKREALSWLDSIGNWLHKNPNTHEKRNNVMFALNVCHDATQLSRDSFVEQVVDKLT